MHESESSTRRRFALKSGACAVGVATLTGCLGGPHYANPDSGVATVVNETDRERQARLTIERPDHGTVTLSREFALAPGEQSEKLEVDDPTLRDTTYAVTVVVADGPTGRTEWTLAPCQGRLGVRLRKEPSTDPSADDGLRIDFSIGACD